MAGTFIFCLLVGVKASKSHDEMQAIHAASINMLQASTALMKRSDPVHPWPHSRGAIPGQNGKTGADAPENLSSKLSWTFNYPDTGEYVIAGGPVIDADKNVYLMTGQGLHKFSADGKLLWKYELWHMENFRGPGVSNNQVSLSGDTVYGSSKTGYAFAVDTSTGKARWETRLAADAGGDCGYPAAFDGVFVMGADRGYDKRSGEGGNQRVFGLDIQTGNPLWEFRPDNPVWNLTPLFPDDGTVVFMDFTGGVYRLQLHDGRLLWHTPQLGSNQSFSDGGASLGPDRTIYTCSNLGTSNGKEGTSGALRAFGLADGMLLWEHILPQPCNSFPAVGNISGSSSLAVVVAPGSFLGQPTIHGGIMAFDAKLGTPIWQFQAPVWHPTMKAAKGDDDPAMWALRTLHGVQPRCVPAHWSAVTLSGDGKVFAHRSDGWLYMVRGPTGGTTGSNSAEFSRLGVDYPTSPGVEYEVFDGHASALHGAVGWAPGMTALGTCWSLFVFKY
eukprot:TRINITY_DN88108_c0_g1_i1.p1 TRINITY_DN88108_c0_g1~~TRINITY_DN88108_c0_g1_i1.p1  ORF type:complete len:501 (+),score=67.97 TRINITY_DN88108_c0_g1_i1:62-1564(+)